MPTHHIRSTDLSGIHRELEALLKQHNSARRKRIKAAVTRAAQKTATYVRDKTIPTAFYELADSLAVEYAEELDDGGFQATVRADAPHAAAVEEGSRPHTPPLEPLIKWVKLRGMQGLQLRGLNKSRSTKSKPLAGLDSMLWKPGAKKHLTEWLGKRHASQARRIATELQRRVQKGTKQRGRHTSLDAPVEIAKAIQAAIARSGTKPYRYMQKAKGFAGTTLRAEVYEAVPDP